MLEHVPMIIGEDINAQLRAPPITEEIKKFVFIQIRPQVQMASQWNSSNPDGRWLSMIFMGWWRTPGARPPSWKI